MYYLLVALLVLNLTQSHDFKNYLELSGPLLLQIGLTYFNLYFLIPELLFAKKYIYYCISLLFALVIVAVGILMIHKIYAFYGSQLFAYDASLTLKNIVSQTIDLIYMVGLTAGIKFGKDWILNRQRIKEREKQYLETELNFLKSQIQPHFFFNTLNNLYALSLKKSDMVPELILKLSNLMSYMLYESNSPLVPLQKEISYLESYLAVEQLRFGDRLSLNFDKELMTGELFIPPMILILFIENGFKHGAKNNIDKIAINISVKIENGFLHFRVENPVSINNNAIDGSGIGLRNGKRRLDLLYGDDYTLDLSVMDNLFIASLKIPVC